MAKTRKRKELNYSQPGEGIPGMEQALVPRAREDTDTRLQVFCLAQQERLMRVWWLTGTRMEDGVSGSLRQGLEGDTDPGLVLQAWERLHLEEENQEHRGRWPVPREDGDRGWWWGREHGWGVAQDGSFLRRKGGISEEELRSLQSS